MKKYIIYLGILLAGLLFGWLLFGGSSEGKTTHNHDETTAANQQWTCSMHPQIMQPEPGDCPICGMDLIPAEAGADGLRPDEFKLSKNAMALANVQTSVVGDSETEGNTIKLSGKIVENEEANAVQVSYFSGRIERLNVNYVGEEVRKGQLLATIYSPELFAAQQELITAASLKESQPALYQAVRRKLKLWKLSEKQINQIENLGKVKENFPVYATVSGTVSEKLVEEGAAIKQGQPLLKIANLNTVWANFDVYENQIDLFNKGQEITITTNAYPNKKFKAKVDFIDPVLNTKTRTVSLRVVLKNSKDTFKPGMFVEGRIEVINHDKKELLSVPTSAVLWTGERSVVYVKTSSDQPVFEMREVKLGNEIGENYEVIKGLKKGDEIVTNGTFTIDAAAQLQGKKSMMNNQNTMDEHAGHSMNEAVERIEVSAKFQNQLKSVFENYIQLKDALVKDDANISSISATTLQSSLNKVDMKLLKDESAHSHWMPLEKEIKSAAKSISSISDIKKQRDHFKHLSTHLTKAVQLFGVNQKIYHQFCPMANNNKGAYWLSLEEKVLNPYFGDAMLRCGEVKETIE
ncbi:putative Co/Zn/Cd efflux system membrane fusion protein [Tenacibaculum sp. 190130A14a]|uniref:Membrane fusion protein, copper/silver efflux system n=1 Tax=Tenacibaculum polynesiense TaxID=3137857 RepID=A0ABP1F0N5_9FLAO